MKSAAPKGASGADPEEQLAGFIAKFEPDVGRLIEACRVEVKKLLPTTNELVYDNYNFLAIGYSTTERPSDCIVSLAAAANGVGLSFYYGATLPDPEGLLLGSGKQNRFIRLPSVAPFRSPGVLALIQAAIDQADPPPPKKGGGATIIKSISAKQRPRRKI
ncbi:MAG TPA: hypothetical protein VN783_00540 [Thermoanaerobaculia bacterium]|nr:hypothetical protein [Thermoanaerobaculia bacterium]